MEFAFEGLPTAPLVVGSVYRHGPQASFAADPLHPLMGCGNQGGFRQLGSPQEGFKLVVLYSTTRDEDWPDFIDTQTSQFVYYGDNKTPGRQLLDTSRNGNRLLRTVFQDWGNPVDRARIPPFFIFTQAGRSRSVSYRGICAPGEPGIPTSDCLEVISRTKDGASYENYRAVFTFLDAPRIERAWIQSLRTETGGDEYAPEAWLDWRDKGIYRKASALGA